MQRRQTRVPSADAVVTTLAALPAFAALAAAFAA